MRVLEVSFMKNFETLYFISCLIEKNLFDRVKPTSSSR